MNKVLSWFREKPSADLIATILVALILVGRWLWLNWEIEHGRRDRMMDFATYYLASRIILRGMDVYQISSYDWYLAGKDLGLGSHLAVYIYSPLLALLMIPIAVLPYPWAALIWGAATIGTFVGAAWAFARRTELPAWPMLLSLLVFMPVNVTMNYGQVNGLILLLMVMFLWNRSWSPLALALAIWIKPWPIWLWLWALWRRMFRTAAMVFVYGMLIGIILLIFAFSK
jgi:alpha-1,2-mannosyltransferase